METAAVTTPSTTPTTTIATTSAAPMPVSSSSTLPTASSISALRPEQTSQIVEKLLQVISELIALLTRAPSQSAGSTPSTASSTPPTTTAPSTANNDPGTLGFKEKIRALIKPDTNGSISEEKLQYAIVSYQLYQKSAKLQESFRTAYEFARDDGYSIQEATKRALKEMQDSGKLAAWESTWVYSLSHRAAQLDSNVSNLSDASADSLGFERALTQAELSLVGIQSGSIKVENRPIV